MQAHRYTQVTPAIQQISLLGAPYYLPLYQQHILLFWKITTIRSLYSFLTKPTKVCQVCHKQFHSENTDLPHNIILAQLERKVICSPSTGTQIMTKEPPLHYYPQLYPVSAPFVLLFTHQMLIPLSKSNRNTQRIHCLKD